MLAFVARGLWTGERVGPADPLDPASSTPHSPLRRSNPSWDVCLPWGGCLGVDVHQYMLNE